MYRIYLFVAFVIAVVAAAPVGETVTEVVQIVESESVNNPDGSYKYMYRSADGNYRQEEAVVHNAGTDEESLAVSGSYMYTDKDGKEVVVNYTADENGFVPIGSNIPEEISNAAKAAADLPHAKEEVVHKPKAPVPVV